MQEKFELIQNGKESYLIRRYKKHWWSRWKTEMYGDKPKRYPVNQDDCAHRLVFVRMVTSLPMYVSLPLYRCQKCGYEQISNEHLEGNKYE